MTEVSNPSTSCADRAIICPCCGTGEVFTEEGDCWDDCIEEEQALAIDGGKYSVGYALTLDDVYY